MGRLNQCQGISLVEWKRFLSNEVGTQNTRVWTICRGKGMLKRITNAIACYRHTLEEKEISTLSTELKSIECPTPPVGALFNSLNSNISRSSPVTGINVPVSFAILLSSLTQCIRKGKYRVVGTSCATPVIICVTGYTRGRRSFLPTYVQSTCTQSFRQLIYCQL